jgi:hypothetical protein
MVDEPGDFPSLHHLPWFSMLIYRLGDEQKARCWPQFRAVVLPHLHDGHKINRNSGSHDGPRIC